MVAHVTSMPTQGSTLPVSAHSKAHDTGKDSILDQPVSAPMPLELVELDLALDLNDIASHGFGHAVREAAKTVKGEFLFDLPASGLAADAQRIAIVCLSREDGGRFALVLLSANGDQARTMEPDAKTADLVTFAKAFVAVLEKL